MQGVPLADECTFHFVILGHLSSVIRHPWLALIARSHLHLIVVGYLERLAICHQSSGLGPRCMKYGV